MLRKTILAVAVIVVALVAVFLIAVTLQPAEFRISRSARMSAPPPEVFAQVNNFHHWQNWSPWEKLDPDLQRTYSGPSEGEGAKYAWTGNDKVGAGNMTITESRPSALIVVNLQFLKPFEATNVTEFSFQGEGDKTLVTWSMAGKNNFISKAMCMFMDMDKLIGADFEKGLASMKEVVEAAPQATENETKS